MHPSTTFNMFCFMAVALTVLKTTARPTCEPIKIPLCERHLPYNMTMFPNALEQLSQKHARQKIDLFHNIVAINCSREAGFFLCSYHLPICAPVFKSRPIRPCRSVCEKVMADCMPTIRKYKAKWPEDVVCEDLPSYNSDVCVTPDSFVNSGKLKKKKQIYFCLFPYFYILDVSCTIYAIDHETKIRSREQHVYFWI